MVSLVLSVLPSACRLSGVYGRQSCQAISLFLYFNKTRPVACLVRSVCRLEPSASFQSFLASFFSFSIRACSPARAHAAVACCQLFGAFELTRGFPCAFRAAFSVPRVRRVRKAVVPGKFVVSVFQRDQAGRMPGAQCLSP